VREAQDLFKRESAGRPLDQRLARCDVELVLLRLDVLAAVGEHRECVSLATRRIPRLRDVIDSRLVGEALLRLAASERVLGDLDAALEHVGEVLAITERGGAHALRCRAKSLCGLICEQRGQLDRSERYYSDALELARAIGDDLEEERARSALARRRLIEGDLPSARRDFQQLLSTAEQRGEKLRITGYVDSLALIAHEEGHDEEAEIGYRRLIQLAKPAGDRRLVAVGLLHIGIIRRDQRRFDDALSLMARAARVLGDIDNIEGLAAVHIAESRTLLDKGDAKRALDKATEAFDQAEKAASAFHLADASICRGLALVHAGSVGDGLADITRGLHAARVANANRIVLEGLLAETEARKRLGEDQRARESAREGAARAESTGHRRFAARFTALAARLSVSI
jgi:tetratricopeptide (TPR) repeat protein